MKKLFWRGVKYAAKQIVPIVLLDDSKRKIVLRDIVWLSLSFSLALGLMEIILATVFGENVFKSCAICFQPEYRLAKLFIGVNLLAACIVIMVHTPFPWAEQYTPPPDAVHLPPHVVQDICILARIGYEKVLARLPELANMPPEKAKHILRREFEVKLTLLAEEIISPSMPGRKA